MMHTNRSTCAPACVTASTHVCCMPFRPYPLGVVMRPLRLLSYGNTHHVTRTHATSSPVNPMLHPPGPGKVYPEVAEEYEAFLDGIVYDMEQEEKQRIIEGVASGLASGLPDIDSVIETPPEWGRPDEGTPNQPRRPPEYNPPQEPVPGIGQPPPEFDPPERSRPSPPVPEDDPMRPLPPEQPEIPPNERDPLKKAPEQMPGERPARRGDEQTQPQPGEASAFAEEPLQLSEEEVLQLAEQAEQEAEAFEQETLYYIDWCRQSFGIRGLVNFYLSDSGLPLVHLTHPNGSTATVHLHGANVTSWTNPGGQELLHLREQGPNDPIRGGIPLCFPNWGHKHGLPTDGFLQHLHWSVAEAAQSPLWAEDPAPQITLVAEADEETLAIWPHNFEARYTVQLMMPDDFPDITPSNRYYQPRPKEAFGSMAEATLEPEADDRQQMPTMQLRCELEITNMDDVPFTFTTGLQSHVACQDLNTHHPFARMLGLGAKNFIDYSVDSRKPKLMVDSEDYVHFGRAEVHRMYIDAYSSTVKFCPGDQTHFELLLREGLTDLGTMNQGLDQQRHAEFADFVVLTPAQSGRPVTLESGESWKGEAALRWHDKYWEIPLFERGPQPGGISDQVMPGYEDFDRTRKMPVLPPRHRQTSKKMPAFDQ